MVAASSSIHPRLAICGSVSKRMEEPAASVALRSLAEVAAKAEMEEKLHWLLMVVLSWVGLYLPMVRMGVGVLIMTVPDLVMEEQEEMEERYSSLGWGSHHLMVLCVCPSTEAVEVRRRVALTGARVALAAAEAVVAAQL
jgi:hypothetical protein